MQNQATRLSGSLRLGKNELGIKKTTKKKQTHYLQVSLYISSGVWVKGSVFFFEPGLERVLTALQSIAERQNFIYSPTLTLQYI